MNEVFGWQDTLIVRKSIEFLKQENWLFLRAFKLSTW
jgi:hypothetical protein